MSGTAQLAIATSYSHIIFFAMVNFEIWGYFAYISPQVERKPWSLFYNTLSICIFRFILYSPKVRIRLMPHL